MNKTVLVLLAALALAVSPLFVQGLGLTLGVETRTFDITDAGEDDEFNLAVKPFVDTTVTGLGPGSLLLELNYAIPALPDFEADAGALEFLAEYGFSAAGLDWAVAHDVVYYADDLVEDDSFDGLFYVGATCGLPVEGLALAAEVDLYYAQVGVADDPFAITACIQPQYAKDFGPGSFSAKLRNNFFLYQKDEDAQFSSIELRFACSMPVGPVKVKLDVRPKLAPITSEDDADTKLWIDALLAFSCDL